MELQNRHWHSERSFIGSNTNTNTLQFAFCTSVAFLQSTRSMSPREVRMLDSNVQLQPPRFFTKLSETSNLLLRLPCSLATNPVCEDCVCWCSRGESHERLLSSPVRDRMCSIRLRQELLFVLALDVCCRTINTVAKRFLLNASSVSIRCKS